MNIVGRTGLTGKDECFVILEKHALEMDRTMREQSISALAGNVQARDSIIVSYVSALLLSQFQSASIRSFYLSVQAPKQRGTLLLRIFATDTYYTSSDTHVSCAEDNPLLNGSSRALKVLYIDNLPSKVYEGAIKDAEELLVSEAAYLAVERILLRSSNTLPPQGRTLQMLGKQWSLGLLPRFRAEQAST